MDLLVFSSVHLIFLVMDIWLSFYDWVWRFNYRTTRCLFVIKKYLASLLSLSNNTKYYRTEEKGHLPHFLVCEKNKKTAINKQLVSYKKIPL